MEDVFEMEFDPRNLKIFNAPEAKGTSNINDKIYHTRPKEATSEDGVYRSIIKVIYNPFDRADSVVEQQTYAMEDNNGFFTAISKLTENDKNCPIFKAWAKCRYSKDENMQAIAKSVANGGPGYFDKRFARYVTIQVIEDKNQPDLEGNYMIWKMPASIWEKINNKTNPSVESKKAAIPVMDFLFGRAIELEVTPGPKDPKAPERETREISYATSEISDDVYTCINPDKSSMLSAEEQEILDTYVEAMTKVWKQKDPAVRATMDVEVRQAENTKKLAPIYKRVMEEIKKYCPNVREEMGYKEWTPELTARVNAYLEVVLAGKNPHDNKTVAQPTADAATVVETTTVSTANPTPAPAPVAESSEDDLPF